MKLLLFAIVLMALSACSNPMDLETWGEPFINQENDDD